MDAELKQDKELELYFNKKACVDMIKKMAVPLGFTKRNLSASKGGYLNPIIFPTVKPLWENNDYLK